MWGIISWILFGLIAGAIAKMISPGEDPGGWLGAIVVGILGSFLGGALGEWLLGWGSNGEDWSIKSFIVAIAGAVLLLFIYKKVMGKR